MEIGDIRPVQSAERTATSDRNSNRNPRSIVPTKSRHQFSRIFDEDDGVIYRGVDEEAGLILTQVPSEEVLRVAKRLQQLLSDRKAK
jgi:hypothetical protein